VRFGRLASANYSSLKIKNRHSCNKIERRFPSKRQHHGKILGCRDSVLDSKHRGTNHSSCCCRWKILLHSDSMAVILCSLPRLHPESQFVSPHLVLSAPPPSSQLWFRRFWYPGRLYPLFRRIHHAQEQLFRNINRRYCEIKEWKQWRNAHECRIHRLSYPCHITVSGCVLKK
jgi:hypothetical protein